MSNELICLIMEEISRCQELHPNKDVNTVRILKESILKQLLLDYSARICTPLHEITGFDCDGCCGDDKSSCKHISVEAKGCDKCENKDCKCPKKKVK